MLVEARVSLIKYANMINEACANGYRKEIRVISREKMLESYTENSYLSSKVDNLTHNLRQSAFSALQSLRENSTNNTVNTEANLIKWLIYEAKLDSLEKKVLQLKFASEPEYEFLSMKNLIETKVDSPRRCNSKLRKRGEEWKDRVYVDDAPENGPQLYILLTGFRDTTLLPLELIKIGLPLRCILKYEISLPVIHNGEELSSSYNDSFDTLSFFDHLNDSKLLNDVIIRTFCPPVDCLDLYDRLSYVLYDIYESLQAHQEYLARMRVFDVEEEKRGEMYLRYELATSWLPEELAVVSLLLEKMLQLVEEEVTDDDGYDDKEAGGPSESFSNSCSETSTLLNTANSDPLDRIELKLYLLNLKYELAQPRANETSLDEFRLILHGDELWLNACRANDALLLPASNSKRCQAESLKVAPQPQPLDPRITTAWKDNDEEVRNCQYQMEDIFQYCTEQGMSRSDGLHALNLLAIKKMYAMRRKKNSQNSKQNSMPSLDKTSSKKPLEKAPSYSLTNTSKAKKPSGSQQNNLLNQSLYEEDYPAIFGLIDAREIFDVSDSEDGDVCGSSNDGRCPAAPFDGIEDVECLGYAAFLQIVRDCFRRVDQRNHSDSFVLVEHFVPTDSILLLFVDQDDDYGQELESSDTCVLRTPVCLHDFSDYVEDEELDWLESRRKSNDGNKLAQRLRQVMKQTDVQRPTINDADFYLPGSLKACELQILRDAECNAPGNSRCSSKVNAHESISIRDDSSLSSDKSNEAFDFIGYDLGNNRRVQLSHTQRCRTTKDGTRIGVSSETWLINGKVQPAVVCISVDTIGDNETWSLKCHAIEGQAQQTFELTDKNGTIVAFSRRLDLPQAGDGLLYDIQISCPSGLMIKPMEHENVKYPFYIQQQYCVTASNEFCNNDNNNSGDDDVAKNEKLRKYLSNGDIVKVSNDGSVVVLRPNGIVIKSSIDAETDESCSRSSTPNHSTKNEDSFSDRQYTETRSSHGEGDETTKAPQGYLALMGSGERYEICEGRIIRELDRLRANLAEEYEPGKEKFARRADGTDMLFNDSGQLIVQFSDGTRTMSCCQWDESVQRQDSVDADFVWVEARGYAEHPSYATVERGYSTMILFRVSLSNLRVEFGLDGNVTLTNDDGGSKIMLNESSVLLTRQACHSCGACSSRLTFHLAEAIPEDHPAATLLTCRDSLARQSFGLSRRDLRFETSSEEKAKGADEPLTRKCDCGREEAEGKKAAASASIKKNRKCRLFSLTRNQEAYEYHHRSVWLDHLENKMLPKGEKEEPTASLIVEGQRRIALVPFANYRPAWLLDYKIQEAKPSHCKDEEWNKPLVFENIKLKREKTYLITRIFEAINFHSRCKLKSLLAYWHELVSGSKKKEVKTGKKRPMTCEGQEYWEKRVRDWARGRGTTINWDSYEAGRRVNFDT
ncbi:hypothetical protein TKK_0015687 [Trichogramma kaykai]